MPLSVFQVLFKANVIFKDFSRQSCIGLLRVSEYSDIRGSEFKIEYRYSSLPKSLDRDLFFFSSSFF